MLKSRVTSLQSQLTTLEEELKDSQIYKKYKDLIKLIEESHNLFKKEEELEMLTNQEKAIKENPTQILSLTKVHEIISEALKEHDPKLNHAGKTRILVVQSNISCCILWRVNYF